MAVQIIGISTPKTTLGVGEQFTVIISYNVDEADNTLTGVGFGIHFDSTKLTLNSINPTFTTNLFGTPAANPEDITDSDAATNQKISWQYLDFVGNWPNQALPTTLGTITFTTLAAFNTSNLNVTVNAPAAGYTGQGNSLILALPSLAIAPTDATKNEGNTGTTPFTFTVTRTGDVQTIASTATYTVTGSGANPADAADFVGGTFPTGTVNFAAGETSPKTITINVAGDSNVEPNENFTVTLSSPSNALLITPSAIGTITNDDLPNVSVAVSPTSVIEDGATNLVYTFTRTGATIDPLTVNFAASSNGIIGTDFTVTGVTTLIDNLNGTGTGTVTFAAGSSTVAVTVDPTADTLFESNLTISTNVTSGIGYTAITTPVSATITDDDPAPAFSIAPISITEGGLITFIVSRDKDAQMNQSVTVSTSIAGGDTASTNDFTANSTTLNFAKGDTTKTFSVQTTQDEIFEGNETFTVTLSNPTGGATIGTAAATGTTNNDDATPSFAIAAASATESGTITFTVTRTRDAQALQTVTFATSILGSDTASTGDFITATGTLSFAQGETSRTFTVQNIQDAIFEGNETFTVTLSNPTGGATIGTATVIGTINNDDATPTYSVATAIAGEGNTLSFTISRIGDSQASQDVTASTITVTDDLATSGLDFTSKTEVFTFAQGETSKTFTVTTLQDTIFEGNETFSVRLSGNVINVGLDAKGTIVDDELPPGFSVSALGTSVNEGGILAFTVSRSSDQGTQSITVNTLLDGTTTASASDFTANTQTLTFVTGETQKTFNVQTTQDNLFEANETIKIILSNPTGGAVISNGNGTTTGTIINDDLAPAFAITSTPTAEGGAVGFTITRSRDAQDPQAVTVATSIGGTDTAAIGDFTAKTETLTFAQGETTKTVTVQTIQDTVFERNEVFTATLSNATGGATIGTATAIGTITNDDSAPVFSIASAAAIEGSAIAFTITRTGEAQDPQSVAVATSIGVADTASVGDFTDNTTTLTFAQGETTKTFTVQTTVDALAEPNETFTVTLSNPTAGTTISPTNGTATGTIQKLTVSFGSATFTATENATNTTLAVPITLNGIPTSEVVVPIQVITGGTASTSDFALVTTSITFSANTTTLTQNANITINADDLPESNETILLQFGTITGAEAGTINSATVTIGANDALTYAIASSVTSVMEGNTGSTPVTFTVTRTGGIAVASTVDYAIAGTAANGSDFNNIAGTSGATGLTGTISFGVGETSKTITLGVLGDTTSEPNETIIANLLNPSSSSPTPVLATGSATININDDDNVIGTKLTKGSNDVFTIVGQGKPKLKVLLTGASSSFVNEVGIFLVDNALGSINGIAPGTSGYNSAAFARSRAIFSTISNKPAGFNTNDLSSLLELASANNLRFYLVKNATTDDVLRSGDFSNVLFSSSSTLRITDLGSDSFSLGWEDGSGRNDFQDLGIRISASDEDIALGTSQQSNARGGEVIDLRFASGLATDITSVKANFVVNREAAFNNFVGFYKVTDVNGGIDTNNDGIVDVAPGQSGYIQAAIRGRVQGIDLSVNNQGTASFSGIFGVNAIFAPFIIANGGVDLLLDSNASNDPAVYFPFLGANSDGVDHIRMLGSNIFGFEDLPNGGDRDFNDIIVKTTLTAIK